MCKLSITTKKSKTTLEEFEVAKDLEEKIRVEPLVA